MQSQVLVRPLVHGQTIFPRSSSVAWYKEARISECLEEIGDGSFLNILLTQNFNDWEIGNWISLMALLDGANRQPPADDIHVCKFDKRVKFFAKSYYLYIYFLKLDLGLFLGQTGVKTKASPPIAFFVRRLCGGAS